MKIHEETWRDMKRHKKTLRDIWRHEETWKDRNRHERTEMDMKRHEETWKHKWGTGWYEVTWRDMKWHEETWRVMNRHKGIRRDMRRHMERHDDPLLHLQSFPVVFWGKGSCKPTQLNAPRLHTDFDFPRSKKFHFFFSPYLFLQDNSLASHAWLDQERQRETWRGVRRY